MEKQSTRKYIIYLQSKKSIYTVVVFADSLKSIKLIS